MACDLNEEAFPDPLVAMAVPHEDCDEVNSSAIPGRIVVSEAGESNRRRVSIDDLIRYETFEQRRPRQ